MVCHRKAIMISENKEISCPRDSAVLLFSDKEMTVPGKTRNWTSQKTGLCPLASALPSYGDTAGDRGSLVTLMAFSVA